jgi:hypothetical protein
MSFSQLFPNSGISLFNQSYLRGPALITALRKRSFYVSLVSCITPHRMSSTEILLSGKHMCIWMPKLDTRRPTRGFNALHLLRHPLQLRLGLTPRGHLNARWIFSKDMLQRLESSFHSIENQTGLRYRSYKHIL